MKNPIIFLNIDGVLISEDYIINNCSKINEFYIKVDNHYFINFEKNKVDLLKNLVEETDAYIIIVSYWCELNNLDQLKKIFKKYGLDEKIIDIVPFSPSRSGYRIKNWLIQKSNEYTYLNNENFVILDNDDTGILNDNHIKCNSKIGLSSYDINNAKKMLKKK